MTTQVGRRIKLDRAAILLLTTATLLLVQLGFVSMLFGSPRQYHIYWRPYHIAVLCVVSVVLIAAPVATTISVLFFAHSHQKPAFAISITLLPIAMALAYGNCLFWWILALEGSGYTVAETRSPMGLYRLDYTAGGDPPVSSYRLYECRPFDWWCRENGSLYSEGATGYQQAQTAELVLTSEDSLFIVLDGNTVARYSNEHLVCEDVGNLWCY